METLRILPLLFHCALMATGEDTTVVNLSKELESLNKSARQELSGRGKDKSILRYGFHKTDLCMDYERAFLCVRKCLDIGYDVAYSDKRCKCTCYRKKEKAKFTPPGRRNRTKYRKGTPTTKLPAWAQPPTPEPFKSLYDKDKADGATVNNNGTDKGESGDDEEGKDEDGNQKGDDNEPEGVDNDNKNETETDEKAEGGNSTDAGGEDEGEQDDAGDDAKEEGEEGGEKQEGEEEDAKNNEDGGGENQEGEEDNANNDENGDAANKGGEGEEENKGEDANGENQGNE